MIRDPTTIIRPVIEHAKTIVPDETQRRLIHAIKALRGKSRDYHRPLPDYESGIRLEIEDPRSRGLENPAAAFLGRVSKAEQRYFAARMLEDEFKGVEAPGVEGRTALATGAIPFDEHLHRASHDLREDAIEAARARMELERGDSHVKVVDPATGWQARQSVGYADATDADLAFAVETLTEDGPRRFLEYIEQQVIDP